MGQHRTFKCPIDGTAITTNDDRKMFCSKKCADRSRNMVAQVAADGTRYFAKRPQAIGSYDTVDELRFFSYLTQEGKNNLLLGGDKFSIVGFDIEATHLKANVGRILCCSFKPLDGNVYTFKGTDPRFKMPDNYDDTKLAAAIRDELEKYDIIVGWNSKNFDVKFINARNLTGGERTKDAQYHVDGMWSWRSKAAAWSGLAAVQQFVAEDEEVTKTSIAWKQWMRAIGWDKKLRDAAMAEIVDHCERDVIVLEYVYKMMVNANVVRSIRKDGGVM